jgi:hypothetical protein
MLEQCEKFVVLVAVWRKLRQVGEILLGPKERERGSGKIGQQNV